jgi:hypothetical protein
MNLNSIAEKKVTVIIRSVGERTEHLCRELILAQGLSPDHIFIVRDAPFSAALQKSFEIGIARGLPWTLCVDADVLLRPGAIEHLLALAEHQPENVCEIQGYILDKFYGGPRGGGPHLYRTSLLSKSIKQIPTEGFNIRPEAHTLAMMKSKGYPFKIIPYLTGLHDFEQYYADIFRKCFVHAHKHLWLTELFLAVWRSGAPDDRDFEVALRGFAHGIMHREEVLIDIRSNVYLLDFSNLDFKEKTDCISYKKYSPEAINQIIENWNEPEEYQKRFPDKMGLEHQHLARLTFQSAKKNLADDVNEYGVLKIIPIALGKLFSRLGTWLQTQAKKS